PDRVAGPDAQACKRGGEAPDPLPQLTVCKASRVAIDDLLIGSLEQRRMPQMLDEQRILVDGLCGCNNLARTVRRRNDRRLARCDGVHCLSPCPRSALVGRYAWRRQLSPANRGKLLLTRRRAAHGGSDKINRRQPFLIPRGALRPIA